MTEEQGGEPIKDDEVVEALELLAKEDEDGLIQPEAVVEAAKDPSSPLHRFFQWDDTEAAHQYRLSQARKLIVRVVVTRVERTPEMVNVTIRRSDGVVRRGYVPTARAVTDEDMYQQILDDARRGIEWYRNRLARFEQARGFVEKLDDALREP